MKWEQSGPSADLEDRRGETPSYSPPSGGGGPRRRVPLTMGGLVVVLIVYALRAAFDDGSSPPPPRPSPSSRPTNREPGRGAGSSRRPPSQTAEEQTLVRFVSFVLDDAQRTWTRLFNERGMSYQHCKLVLFRRSTQSACGRGSSDMGPFYCPADRKAYIDLSFYDELRQRFGAPGDFAQAYVLAHEIGHHVQNLLGLDDQMAAQLRRSPGSKNSLSVAFELQADCLAGVWAKSTGERGILEPGDVEEGMRAAAAIGDDKLQRDAGRTVRPESFTHGSSQQRVDWFMRGYRGGTLESCDAQPAR